MNALRCEQQMVDVVHPEIPAGICCANGSSLSMIRRPSTFLLTGTRSPATMIADRARARWPNIPVPVHLMLRDEGFRGQVVEASMIAPIHLTGDFSAVMEELLPILRQGRFILRHDGPPDDTNELVEKLSRNRNPL